MILNPHPVIMSLAGAGLIVYSILLAAKIFRQLPRSGILKWWGLLLAFIATFAVCAFIFTLAFSNRLPNPLLQLTGAVILFSGIYMLLTLQLFTHTLSCLTRSGGLHSNGNNENQIEIYNLRQFEKRLHEEFDRARRYKSPLSVLLIEIDNFQNTSGMYGNMMSDQAFMTISGLITNSARASDILARYGGDQLVMLLPNTALYSAMKAAEKYRGIIEGKVLDVKDAKDAVISVRLNYTVSIGVATLQNDVKQASELTRRADIALYKAKDRGRNRVALYGE